MIKFNKVRFLFIYCGIIIIYGGLIFMDFIGNLKVYTSIC